MTVCFSSFGWVSAQAIKPQVFAGTWVMQLGERNLLVLNIETSDDGITGSMEEPAEWTDQHGLFVNIRGGVRLHPIRHAEVRGGVLHIAVQNGNNPKDDDTYSMSLNGDAALLVSDETLPSGDVTDALLFKRASAAARVASDWEPNRVYTKTDSDVPSAEMKAIFTEDQRVRMNGSVDWKEASRTDAERREQTRKLIAAGALHTGKDYEEAAFIFQHGDSAADYLLAHTLAMIAVSKGDASAIWTASATLDRYLQKIGQKQIFGTQFSRDSQHGWTQEPYDRGFVSDALRGQLGVPSQSEQAEQLKGFETRK